MVQRAARTNGVRHVLVPPRLGVERCTRRGRVERVGGVKGIARDDFARRTAGCSPGLGGLVVIFAPFPAALLVLARYERRANPGGGSCGRHWLQRVHAAVIGCVPHKRQPPSRQYRGLSRLCVPPAGCGRVCGCVGVDVREVGKTQRPKSKKEAMAHAWAVGCVQLPRPRALLVAGRRQGKKGLD